MYSTGCAFAIVRGDGEASSIYAWGHAEFGGDCSAVRHQLTGGITNIYSTGRAFAALMETGTVVTWGHAASGGDSSSVQSQLSSGVKSVVGTKRAFAAIKVDGSVVAWGDPNFGGYRTVWA